MIYTVEQAEKIWCPHVRRPWEGEQGTAAVSDPHHDTCIANKCSAWRWKSKGERFYDPATGNWYDAEDSSYGYCGLAGKPEQ